MISTGTIGSCKTEGKPRDNLSSPYEVVQRLEGVCRFVRCLDVDDRKKLNITWNINRIK